MPKFADFYIVRGNDGLITVGVEPPTPIGGWEIQFLATHRFGGVSGIIDRRVASGYGAGQSGITILNSGQGIFQVNVWAGDTSGSQFGNIVYTAKRLDSGFQTDLALGTIVLQP